MNDKVKTFIRNISKETLQSYGKIEQVELSDLEPEKIRRDWLSMILINGDSIKISFKVFFSEQDVIPLITKKIGPNKPAGDFRGSFMNEYSNVAAGRIRHDLLTNGYDTKISLPLHTKVLHGIEFFKQEETVMKDVWLCSWGTDESIICSSTLKVFDPGFDKKFEIPEEESKSSGAIELL